jgi:Flp pilus assembly protein TadG
MIKKGRYTTLKNSRNGQSMLEFALILPLMVLFIVGIFELGRGFFAYIAISNAAREGVRMYTFTPDTTTIAQIKSTVKTEVGTASLVDPNKITSIAIACGNAYVPVITDLNLAACPHEQPVRVTVTYTQDLILGVFFSQPILLKRSVEMMKP